MPQGAQQAQGGALARRITLTLPLPLPLPLPLTLPLTLTKVEHWLDYKWKFAKPSADGSSSARPATATSGRPSTAAAARPASARP